MFEPSEEQYFSLTSAAKASGIIDEIVPYEDEGILYGKIKPLFFPSLSNDPTNPYDIGVLDNHDYFHKLPYEQKLCHLPRADMDDSYAIPLFAMLPKLNDLSLEVTDEEDAIALPWPKSTHGFASLRRLALIGTSTHQVWATGSINNALRLATNLNELVLHNSPFLCYRPEGTRMTHT
jgi:hypothetical protein